MSWSLWMRVLDSQGQARQDTRGERCSSHISTLSPHLCPPTGLSELRRRDLCGCPLPGLLGGARRLETSSTPSSGRQSEAALAPRPSSGAASPARTYADPAAAHPLPLSARLLRGLQAGSAPPFPGPLAGLQLRAERSRLGSSSSMALLPHYPDVGPSPPRLYRLSAGSARVMRALLITIAETPLTLTAPSAERQHLLCSGRRPSPAPRSPFLAAPSFRVLSPRPSSPSSLSPHPALSLLSFSSLPTTLPAKPFQRQHPRMTEMHVDSRMTEILRDGDTQRAQARVPRHPKLWITDIEPENLGTNRKCNQQRSYGCPVGQPAYMCGGGGCSHVPYPRVQMYVHGMYTCVWRGNVPRMLIYLSIIHMIMHVLIFPCTYVPVRS